MRSNRTNLYYQNKFYSDNILYMKKREKTDKIDETKNSVIIPVKPDDEPTIKKIDSAVYHDGKRLLYEPDLQWDACCFRCEKDLIIYLGKYSISLLVLLFCMYMLMNPNNQGKEYYSAQISFVLGVYIGVQGNNSSNKSENK